MGGDRWTAREDAEAQNSRPNSNGKGNYARSKEKKEKSSVGNNHTQRFRDDRIPWMAPSESTEQSRRKKKKKGREKKRKVQPGLEREGLHKGKIIVKTVVVFGPIRLLKVVEIKKKVGEEERKMSMGKQQAKTERRTNLPQYLVNHGLHHVLDAANKKAGLKEGTGEKNVKVKPRGDGFVLTGALGMTVGWGGQGVKRENIGGVGRYDLRQGKVHQHRCSGLVKLGMSR